MVQPERPLEIPAIFEGEVIRQPTVIEQSVQWATFEESLRKRGFEGDDLWRISLAFTLALGAHTGQLRLTRREWAFEHPRESAMIFIVELERALNEALADKPEKIKRKIISRTKDPNLVIGTLLHDAAEDSILFGQQREGLSYQEWRSRAEKRIKHQCGGSQVAEIVLTTTKPRVNGIDVLDEEQARRMYYEQFRVDEQTREDPKKFRAKMKAILVKMADRLHNLRSPYPTDKGEPREKLLWKIQETEEVYFPIFETAREVYPEETDYLIGEMKKSVEILKDPVS